MSFIGTHRPNSGLSQKGCTSHELYPDGQPILNDTLQQLATLESPAVITITEASF